MKKVSTFIDSILSEASLDARIRDGVVNLKNPEHAIVVAEKMYYAGVGLELLEEFAQTYIANEGKYPERQAYNKEGWLVTFPSPEYKNAAIKKGTHFTSDPTHGKGGMNVYYKRKGKQKRMTQKDPTQVDPVQQNQPQQQPAPQQPNAPAPQQPQAETPPQPQGNAPKDKPSTSGDEPSSLPKSEPAAGEDEDPGEPSAGGDSKPQGGEAGGQQSGGTGNSPAPASPTPPPAPSFVNISVEFAKSKQWNPTPFGEWRNAMGEAGAVVGLSGEVVPIKSTDREELKLFAAKKQPNA